MPKTTAHLSQYQFKPGEGGRIPGVQNKSTLLRNKRILEEGVPAAIATALDCLNPVRKDENGDPIPCPLCGRNLLRDDNIRLKAATLVLDRTGFGPTQKVEHTEPPDVEWISYVNDEDLIHLVEIHKRAHLRMAEEQNGPLLLEGELITQQDETSGQTLDEL